MDNLLNQGAQLVQTIRQDHLTVAVSYERGRKSITLPATVGKTVFRLDDQNGGTIRYVSRDYLIEAEALADIEPEFEFVEPERGDRIVQTINGRRHTHEVLGPGGDEPDWRFSDPGKTTIRLHTKEVSG